MVAEVPAEADHIHIEHSEDALYEEHVEVADQENIVSWVVHRKKTKTARLMPVEA